MHNDTEQLTYGELNHGALTAFTQEMSNSLMIIQNGLDLLRNQYKNEPHFQWMQGACNQASNALHGTLAMIGGQLPQRENFPLGEFMEQLLPELQQGSTYPLALRIHENCRISTSRQGLSLCLSLLSKQIYGGEGQEIYIEAYRSEQEHSHYAVLTLNLESCELRKDNQWRALKSMLLLQHIQLLEESMDTGLKCHLMMELASDIEVSIPEQLAVESSTALVVESEPRIAEMIAKTLPAFGMSHVEIFNRPEPALQWLSQHSPSLALIEHNLQGMSGLELLERAKLSLRESTIGLICNSHSHLLNDEIEKLGINLHVLVKPFRGNDLSNIALQAQTGQVKAPAEPVASPAPEKAADDADTFKSTIRLKVIPQKQQCPPGFAPDLA